MPILFLKAVLLFQLAYAPLQLLKLPLLRAGCVCHRLSLERILGVDGVLPLPLPQCVLVYSVLVGYTQQASPALRYQLHRRDLLFAAKLALASHSCGLLLCWSYYTTLFRLFTESCGIQAKQEAEQDSERG